MLPELDTAESSNILCELSGSRQLAVASHIANYLLLLHFVYAFQSFGQCLRRKTLVVDLLNSVVNISKILHDKDAVLGQELKERNLFGMHTRQFGYNLDIGAAVFRELVLHFKRANRIDFITEEVDTERPFTREGINIQNASTHSKLTWFVDIVDLLEAKISQSVFNLHNIDLLTSREFDDSLIKIFLRDNQLCQRFRMSHDIKRRRIPAQPCQHLSAQDFVCRITLPVFYRTPIRRREE